ncbi:glycosyltransferase family 2 protein [Photobacterium nomapromontoriensis]|uniref:glycosyltransferase family 2 protein n=1 Tax=Photobacterium nomapromontoriensis TaxID=2910237 RepID=UPI003D14C825
MAKVSVVIPTYNCLTFLPRAVSSVLEQTHQDLELIIINDNSSDNSADYLNTLKDNRIKTITTLGVGASQARNVGIDQACGEYIAFLDADDFWLSEKLSRQLKLHSTYSNIAMSFTNYEHLTETYQPIVDCFRYWGYSPDGEYGCLEKPLELILQKNIIGTSTVMIKADVLQRIGGFNTELQYGEDWDLWLRICESHDIGLLNATQAGYLMRQSSLTQTESLRLRNLRCIEFILARYQRERQHWNLPYSTLIKARARILEGYADYHRGLQQYHVGILFGLRSLLLDPKGRKLRSLFGDCKRLLGLRAKECCK